MTRSILDAFTIFPFAIVLSLALGEAFKTVVSEDHFIYWKKLYALLSFLFLILPFYQGMNRYLLATYGVRATALPPAGFLIVDGTAFMFESALFFAMSRTLAIEKWQQFYWLVVALLSVDSLWGLTVPLHANPGTALVIGHWVELNMIALIILLAALVLVSAYDANADTHVHYLAALGTFGMLVRTVIDYWLSWDFYFQ
jgi:hypothetical protein